MNKVIKLSSLLVALFLVAVFGLQTLSAAKVTVAGNQVEWAAENGDEINSVKPDATTPAHFFIRDNGSTPLLETTPLGTRTFTLPGTATAGSTFDIGRGTVDLPAGTAARVTATALSAPGFNSTTPSATPLSGRPTVESPEGDELVATFSDSAATFKLVATVGGLVTAKFNYDIEDTWSGTDESLRRAKVVSTSDLTGEWVTISEVASVSSLLASATSRLFHGTIILDPDASAKGAGGLGVWVQDGDAVTVNYYNSAGDVLDSTTVTVDGIAPSISDITPADKHVTNVVNPTLIFDVTDARSGVDPTGLGITVKINGSSVPSFSPQGISGGLRIIFAQRTSWKAETSTTAGGGFAVRDETPFDIEISASDRAGNMATSKVSVVIDTIVPRLSSAETGAARTAVAVTFSEPLAVSSVDETGNDFTVEGGSVTAAAVNEDNTNVVDLTVTELPYDLKPKITTVGELLDDAGNAVGTGKEVTASDGIPPGATVVVDTALAIKDTSVGVSITTTETLRSGETGLFVSIQGPAGTGAANNRLATTSPEPLKFSGSRTIATTDASGRYGVSVRATDLSNNATDNLTKQEDTFSAALGANTLTLSKGPVGDFNFDGAIGVEDVTLSGVNATATAVDAGKWTLTVNSVEGELKVTYYYVADHVFEVDHDKPKVSYFPAKLADSEAQDIQDSSPFIQVKFNDDEYPGDTFKAVTLTKAELTKPDGTVEDITANFVARTESEYLWAASRLALGSYTLTVSGKDTAGNELVDDEYLFKISERTFAIPLQPGWNLVSLPDAPESSAVNDVFTAAEITTVITRDRTVPGGWAIADREGSVELTGTLTTIVPSKGYWVESTGIVTVTVDVPGISAGSLALPPAFRLTAGWNLISVAQPDLSKTTRDADEYFAGLDWARAYGYDSEIKRFVPVLPDPDRNPDDDANLTVGRGYFVYLNKSGTLVP